MQKPREHWSTELGFILAAAGSAIGLGTLWKVPYVIGQNGGGLFVLLYILCIFLIGVPVFIAELVLGRKSQRAAVSTFSNLSHNTSSWKIAGWLGVATSFLLMSYYSVVAGWGLNYVLMSLNAATFERSPEDLSKVFSILESSGDISLLWHFIFTGLTVSLVYPGVREGIEYFSKYMTSALFIMLFALFLYGLTLDGFGDALHFIFYPDASHLKPSGALEALGLSFFTLSVGQGIMITYGSYMRKSEDIPRTGLIIGSTIVLASVLAGLTIFPIIFTFGQNPSGGEGLVFKTLPTLFTRLPGALLISTTFFTLFSFAAITSSMAFVEVVVSNCMDLWGWSRKKAVLAVGLGTFLVGVPSALSHSTVLFANWPAIFGMTFFQTINELVSTWMLSIGGLLVALFTGWKLEHAIAKEEFLSGTKLGFLFKPWLFFIRWIAPAAIILIILHSSGIIDLDALILRA